LTPCRNWRRGGKREFVLPPENEITGEFAALEKIGGRFVISGEPDFPHGLAALEPPPPVIAVLGHAHLLQKEVVAVVGARNASALGRRLAWMLARELGEAGLGVVSGLGAASTQPRMKRRWRAARRRCAIRANLQLEGRSRQGPRESGRSPRPGPGGGDELIRQLGAPPGAVLMVLLELELAGRCARHPRNRVSWS